MKVNCPKCERSYNVDDHRIPDEGLKMRCPQCQAVFKVSLREKTAATDTQSPKQSPSSADAAGKPGGALPKRTARESTMELPKPNFSSSLPPLGEPMDGDGELSISEPPTSMPPLSEPPIPPDEPSSEENTLSGNEEFDIPIQKQKMSFDGLDLPPVTMPSVPKPSKRAAAPPTKNPVIEVPPVEGQQRESIDLPELSQAIDLGGVPSPEISRGDIPAALGLPDEPITAPDPPSDLMPSIDDDSERQSAPLDFSASMDGLAGGQGDEAEAFDFPPPTFDDAQGEDSPPSTGLGDGAFGELDLPPVQSDSEPPNAFAPPVDVPADGPQGSISQVGPPSFEDGPPILDPSPAGPADFDNAPDLKAPSLSSTGPLDGLANLSSDQPSSLPPLGVALESNEPSADLGFGEEIPSPADLVGPTPGASPQSPSPTRDIGSGGTSFGEVSLSPDSDAPMGFSMSDEEDDGEFADFPLSTGGTASPDSARSTGTGMDNLDLAEDPMAGRAAGAFIDEPPSELAADLDEQGEEVGREPTAAFEGRRKFERQSRRTKIVFLALLLLVISAGAGMTFTPLGPFGANYLYRLIPKTTNKAVVTQAEKGTERHIKKDTFGALKEGIDEIQKIAKENPNSEELKLLLIYLYNYYQIRFEEEKNLQNAATSSMRSVNLNDTTSIYGSMIRLTQFVRFSRNFSIDDKSLKSLEQSMFGKTILTETYLIRGETAKALRLAKSLEAQSKSPHSGYLLSRVLLADKTEKSRDQAIKRLKEIEKSQKEHMDAKLLLGNALADKRPLDFDQVLSLANGVIGANEKIVIKKQRAEAHALLARAYLIKREYGNASKEVSLAETINPDNVSMLLSKGRLSLKMKDFSQAGTAFNKALANAPDNQVAVLGKIETDIMTGELAAGKKALTALVPKNDSNAMMHYLMGEVDFALKENKEAETSLRRAIELDKELLEAYVTLSKLYLATERNTEAMAILDKASETVPGSPLIKKTLAAAHVAREDYPSAIVELDNALKLNPNDAEAHFMMGQMYLRMKSVDDAKRALAEVEKLNPNYPGLALAQGLVMEADGKVESALSSYKKALSEKPDDLQLKLRVAAAAQILGDLDTAEGLLKEVIEKQPDSAETNFYVGENYRLSGRTTESLAFLAKACELDKTKALYFLRHGMALIDINDTDKAIEALETALELDKKMAEIYIRLGEIRLKQGSSRFAIDTIQKGLALDSEFGEGYFLIAEAHERLSEPDSAVDYYRKAVKFMPDDGELYFKLGMTELGARGNRIALSSFTKAVALGDKKEGKIPEWLYEALYRLGSAQKATGQRAGAITSFKRYLEIAPEAHIDRAQVIAGLDDLGVQVQ